MAFKTLEQRFRDRFGTGTAPQDAGEDPSKLADRELGSLYDGATQKFDKGKPTNESRAEPYVVRAPGDGYWGNPDQFLGRAIPLRSVAEDLKRLTKFSLSGRGLMFYVKQQLLQTGNTFQITRLINPVFVLGAAGAPAIGNALRIRRHLRPITDGLLGKTDKSDTNVKKMAYLQKETWQQQQDRFKNTPSTFMIKVLGVPYTEPTFGSRQFAKVGNLLKQLMSPITNTVKAFTANRSVGDGDDIPWEQRRPELTIGSYTDVVGKFNKLYQDGSPDAGVSKKVAVTNIGIFSSPYFNYGSNAVNNINQGTSATETTPRTVNAKELAIQGGVYISDPLNEIPSSTPQSLLDSMILNNANVRPPLSSYTGLLNTKQKDIIHVAFAMGDRIPIQFRAYLKDLNQSITPEYKNYQYIGRPEKFYSYVSTQREISFKLGVIALKESELDVVWTRINYLTGLVYPFAITKGIYQPNIVRITIGDVYTEQPGFITSLTTNFNEISDSWDIRDGYQVPISAQMDIRFTLVEKRSKTANSPFYGITENMNSFKNSTELDFSEARRQTLLAQRELEKQKQDTELVRKHVDSKLNIAFCRDAAGLFVDDVTFSPIYDGGTPGEIKSAICDTFTSNKNQYDECITRVNAYLDTTSPCPSQVVTSPTPPPQPTSTAPAENPTTPTEAPTTEEGGVGTAEQETREEAETPPPPIYCTNFDGQCVAQPLSVRTCPTPGSECTPG